MTPGEEFILYKTNRGAWIGRVAERTARRFAAMPEIEIAECWPMLGRDYQFAIWAHLSAAERERVRAARHDAGDDA